MAIADGLENDLRVIAEQERLLEFAAFDADAAWTLGGRMRALAAGTGRPVAMGIWVAGALLFYAATPGTAPDNEFWLQRKRATAERFGRSTYRMGLELERDGSTLEEKQGLPMREFCVHGGGFPLRLAGTGCVGAAVLSGLPQRQDHAMVVEAMAGVLGVMVPRLVD